MCVCVSLQRFKRIFKQLAYLIVDFINHCEILKMGTFFCPEGFHSSTGGCVTRELGCVGVHGCGVRLGDWVEI